MPTQVKAQRKSPFFLIMLGTMILISYTLFYFVPLSLSGLKELSFKLKEFSLNHDYLTPFLFIIFYILCAVFSFPGIFLLSLLSGYLFTQPFSTIYPTFAATFGATFLFLLTRTTFAHLLYKNTNKMLIKMENGFQENATHYLLFLRLIPLFPFWLVNLAGAFFKVPLKTFVWTTFIGMLPSTFAYTQAGKGLAELLEPHSEGLNSVLNPHLLMGLAALAVLSIAPLFFKKLCYKN